MNTIPTVTKNLLIINVLTYFRAGMGAKTISVLLSGVRYRSRNYPGGGTVYSL